MSESATVADASGCSPAKEILSPPALTTVDAESVRGLLNALAKRRDDWLLWNGERHNIGEGDSGEYRGYIRALRDVGERLG